MNKEKPERLDFIEGDDGVPGGGIRGEDAAVSRAPYDYIDLLGEPIVPPRAIPQMRQWQNMRLVTTGEASYEWVRKVAIRLIQVAVISIIFFVLLKNVHCRGFTL